MNLYHIVYATTANNTAEMFVVASTTNNAWAACQTQDPSASVAQTLDEQISNVIVGS